MKRILVPVLILLFSAQLVAQRPEEDLARYTSKYPDESVIILEKSQNVLIDITSTGELAVSSRNYEEQFILDKKIGGVGSESLEYSSFTTIDQIEAATLVPKGKKYKAVRVEDFKTKDVLEGAIFHNDIKEVSFHYEGLAPGVKKRLSYRKQFKEPRFLSAFYFCEHVPIEKLKYTVKVHKNVNIAYVLKNTEDIDLKFSEQKKDGYKIYTWELSNVPKLKYESGARGLLYYIPHIIVRITDYTIGGEKQNLLATTDDLYGWYASLIKDINQDDDTELKRIADSLVAGIDDETEKVKRIYYWVQDNIKYVAFEDGLGGFIPRNATAVCDKRFGDCKDMSNITTTMLKLVGINGYLTWIGTTDIPYKYEEVPTPAVDNHMIGAYQLPDGKFVFLDATSSHQPFGLPTGFIQGKEAMVNLGEGEYKIIPVPEMGPEVSYMSEDIELSIEDQVLKGKATAKVAGYYKVNLAYDIDGSSQEEIENYMIGYLRKGSNKFLIDEVEVKNIKNRDVPIEIDYQFNISDYITKAGDEIYINMNMEKSYINESIKEDRELEIARKFRNSLNYVVTLNIPKGYEASYLPEDIKFDHELFSFTTDYEKGDGTITLTTKIVNDYNLLKKKDFNSWNTMIKEMKKAYNESVILKKKEN